MPDGIKVIEARIRNFRCLREVDVLLDDTTLLIGENNAGKTSFIEALNLAIGSSRKSVSEADIYVNQNETKPPKDRRIIIDILIRPTDQMGIVVDTFEQGSFWLALWGNGIAQDGNLNDFAAIRTEVRWDITRGEYILEKKFLSDWLDTIDIANARVNEQAGAVTARQSEPLLYYVLDAQRDIEAELQSRSSFWGKLVSEPGLPDPQTKQIEQTLTDLNEAIISASEILRHTEDHLQDLKAATIPVEGRVAVTSVPRRLRDFKKGMDIHFAVAGAQSFAIDTYGMGTRSLAAILVFRAYTTWRQRLNQSDALHPMLAIEEPESHLHPDAQRALFKILANIPGQRILSTHSPYVAAQGQIGQFRFFHRNGSTTSVHQVDMSRLGEEAATAIERVILLTRGDLLYSRAIVIFEGQTEEPMFPIFAESYWGMHPHSLGISFVRADGKRYRPFVNLAQAANIPWYIFSDGEAEAITAVSNVVTEAGGSYPAPTAFVIPNNEDLEGYICKPANKDILIDGIINFEAKNPQHRQALEARWSTEADPIPRLKERLTQLKPNYGTAIARAFVSATDSNLRIPPLIKQLFAKITLDLQIQMP